MKVEYINPFVASTSSVFETMLQTEITRGEVHTKKKFMPEYEVSGIIGLSGRVAGTVLLSLSEEAAIAATEVLLGDKPDEVNADVVDAVGELTNMIAGGAKAQLEKYNLCLGLPTVITGNDHSVEFPSKIVPICIPFESPLGPLTVDIGFQGAT